MIYFLFFTGATICTQIKDELVGLANVTQEMVKGGERMCAVTPTTTVAPPTYILVNEWTPSDYGLKNIFISIHFHPFTFFLVFQVSFWFCFSGFFFWFGRLSTTVKRLGHGGLNIPTLVKGDKGM